MLQAKLTRRKQRVSAAASADTLDQDVPNVGVGRALTVILALHVVAIAAIYIGTQWNKGEVTTESDSAVAAVDTSKVNTNLQNDFVRTGETYETFAARHGVDVKELRDLNSNVTLRAGLRLTIPANGVDKAQVMASNMRSESNPRESAADMTVSERPAVGALVVEEEAPKAVLVTPRRNPNIPRAIPVSEPGAAGQNYVVQNGDTVWRIAHKFNVNQAELLKVNGLNDPRKLKVGDKLIIPAN